MKRLLILLLKIFAILAVIIAIGFGILFAFDQIFHTNSFNDIKNSINQIFNKPQEQVQEEVDQTPLKASMNTTSMTILEPNTAITVNSNKEISIADSTKLNLVFLKKEADTETNGDKYWYALEIKNIGVGTATVNVEVKDKAGNSQKFAIAITRQGFSLPLGMKSIDPWPNSTYTADGDNLKAQVNKSHKLINDYAPTDLKNLNQDYQLYTNTASIMLRKEAADYLSLMLKQLQKETGKNAVIASGYRAYNEQYQLYAGYIRDMGQEETDKVSARPGFSEHQLGTAVDFIDQDSGLTLNDTFDQDTVGKWITDNSYKYGFIKSYPEGKEDVTGYSYEAWHYRYIGVDNATAVHNSGLTLKEWLEQNP